MTNVFQVTDTSRGVHTALNEGTSPAKSGHAAGEMLQETPSKWEKLHNNTSEKSN